VTGAPIADGAVWAEDGVIRAVGPTREVESAAGAIARNLGDAIVLPGLVNGHCHLELTMLAGIVAPTRPFAGWLTHIIAEKLSRPADWFAISARRGADRLLRTGTTTVGDIVSVDGVDEALAGHPLRRVAFRETLGIGPRREGAVERTRAWLDARRPSDRVTYGIAPHAPYSTAPEVYRGCVELAETRGLRLSTHLAETLEEIEFLELGTGPLRAMLDRLGLLDGSFRAAGVGPRPTWRPRGRLPRAR
jgi:aminodeoxyfutalosine deaminase